MIYLLLLAIIGMLILGMMLLEARERLNARKEIIDVKNEAIRLLKAERSDLQAQVRELYYSHEELEVILVEIWGEDPPDRTADDVVEVIRQFRARL
ncbi:MAG TPA: hypothetical protein VK961_06955 [Chthoniobacter sp.]|nr:hypothetical protein [Chthoniobacter sp.]